MNTEIARQQMVEQQVRTWDVFDTGVLQTFIDVSRERYVPQIFAHCAYADAEIPIGRGQVMLRPSLDARILQSVDIQPYESVLEIGTGTGYLTRCISRIAASVTSVDLYEDFVTDARSKLASDGADNVTLICADATVELPDKQFDAIIVSAAMTEINGRFTELLKNGGRLFVVAGHSPAMTATLITRDNAGEFSTSELFETDIPPLVSTGPAEQFSF